MYQPLQQGNAGMNARRGESGQVSGFFGQWPDPLNLPNSPSFMGGSMEGYRGGGKRDPTKGVVCQDA